MSSYTFILKFFHLINYYTFFFFVICENSKLLTFQKTVIYMYNQIEVVNKYIYRNLKNLLYLTLILFLYY